MRTPRGPIFGPFRSTTSRFRDTRSSKIGNAPNDQIELEYLALKSTLYTLNTYCQKPKFWPVSLYE